MSGVYIKGLEIPENCYQCPFGADVDIGVGVAHGCNLIKDFAQFANERHPDCPLIPVPDHGRLIDADEFYKDINESILLTDGFKVAFNLWFDAQPTVIPADKEGEA